MIKKYIEKVALWRKMIFLRFSTVVEQKPSEKKIEVCDLQTLYSIRGAMMIYSIKSIDIYMYIIILKRFVINMYISADLGIGQERK